MAGAPRPLPQVTASTSNPKPNKQSNPGSIGNTPGLITPKPDPNGGIKDGKPIALTNPPATLETPQEEGWWRSWGSSVTHGVLGAASFVPLLSTATSGVDALVYAAEGNKLEAGLAAAGMIPGGKWVTTGGKLIGKGAARLTGKAAKEAAEKATKEAAEKAAKEAAEKAAKERAAEKLAKEKAEREAAEKARKEDGGHQKGKGKPGPCDHLRKGDGSGPYRGGAHSETSKPRNDLKDSHHMPAKDASPLDHKNGPAIQMDPKDHAKTSSNGQMPGSIEYREMIADLIASGKWREAMAREIQDVRRVARELEDPRKYNEAISEMLAYYKCLEKNGLVK